MLAKLHVADVMALGSGYDSYDIGQANNIYIYVCVCVCEYVFVYMWVYVYVCVCVRMWVC